MTTPRGPNPANVRRAQTRRRNILLKEGFSNSEIRRLRLDTRQFTDPFVKELRQERRGIDVVTSRKEAQLAHRRLRAAIQRGADPEIVDIHRATRSRARLDVLRWAGLPQQMIEQFDLDMVQGNNRGLRYFLQQWNQLKTQGLTNSEARAEINQRLRRVTIDPGTGLDLIFEVYDQATLRQRSRAIRRAA